MGASIAFLCAFSGCVKYHKISHGETPQVREHERFDLVAQSMVKSVTAYEQFRTLAVFDALWLSNPVREVYSYLNTMRLGKNRAAQKALLRRQLEENKHWVSFYVLAEVYDKAHQLLSEKKSKWSVYLKTATGQRVPAQTIKEVELEPEIKWLFRHRYSSFKTAYRVTFPSRDGDHEQYAQEENGLSLIFQSPHLSVNVAWGMPPEWRPKTDTTTKYMKVIKQPATPTKDTVLRDEDFYWC